MEDKNPNDKIEEDEIEELEIGKINFILSKKSNTKKVLEKLLESLEEEKPKDTKQNVKLENPILIKEDYIPNLKIEPKFRENSSYDGKRKDEHNNSSRDFYDEKSNGIYSVKEKNTGLEYETPTTKRFEQKEKSREMFNTNPFESHIEKRKFRELSLN